MQRGARAGAGLTSNVISVTSRDMLSTPVLRIRAGVLVAVVVLCSACGSSEEPVPAPTEEEQVEAFMVNYFEVFDSYDMEAIMALYAADVSAQITALGTLEGAEAVRDQWLVPFTSAFPDYSHTVNETTVEGARATVDFVFSGTHQGPLLGYEPTGKELVLPILGTYDVDVEAERVTHFELEYDVNVVIAAITP